jgi:uncharacterized protein (DUF488 family)
MSLPFFTIGHSTRTISEFVDLLRVGEAEVVVDIRKMPRSRSNPQYNEETLADGLAEHQVGYRRIAALGGLRGRRPEIPPGVNGWWENRSFHNYADYTLSDEFKAGLDELTMLGHQRRTVFMCSEALWWRCHRRPVADQLIAAGESVFHLMDRDRVEPAHLSNGALLSGGVLTYPVR